MEKITKSILLLLLFTPLANAQTVSPLDQKVTATVKQWMKKNQVPGVALELYVDGKPHSYYLGYANRERKTPITKDTLFEVGSFTKLFTCLLLAEEVNAKKMQLNNSITDYLPNLIPANLKQITLENLATHTTGFPFKFEEPVNLKNSFASWRTSSPIGSVYQYSNINIGLIGDAVTTTTKQPIDTLYRNKILQPLGMDPIGIEVPVQYQQYYAQGYNAQGMPEAHLKVSLFPSAGAMKASGNDMLHFLHAAIGANDVPSEITAAMKLTQTSFVRLPHNLHGLGWVINPISKNRAQLLNVPENTPLEQQPAQQLPKQSRYYDPNSLIDKTGATDGFRSYIAVVPARNMGVVVLANRYVSNGEIVKLGRSILIDDLKL